ncbi:MULTISPECIES: response regulator [unclassified Paenibacillus]|uniref:response regulator n=1 Tax=unclassified Paenibacillus TaxID=185978 RepID=UPI0036448E26
MFSILIVDDHKHLVESMATTIPWENFEVTHVYQAYSGQQALELINRHHIHILITDIRMPVMSGLELIEQVRTRWPAIDCILLTGYADFQYAKRAVELQAVNYLIKPVRDEELLLSISKITEQQKHRMREQAELERTKEALEHQLPQLKAELLAARTHAEQSVIEERNRIVHDIHDIVGHTLTATLVQIEAARQLIIRNDEKGLYRLEQSQQLIRKSLDDIRVAVRVMKQPDEEADLESQLRRFIQEAEQTADITVNCMIDLPVPVTDPFYMKVVYHALQEGITNGIRHGNGHYFQLRLHIQDEELRFSLWNDGRPYDTTEMGFGLTGMYERVKQLGGTLLLTASADPIGTLLLIRIPV